MVCCDFASLFFTFTMLQAPTQIISISFLKSVARNLFLASLQSLEVSRAFYIVKIICQQLF